MKEKNGFSRGAFSLPEIEIIYHPNVKLSKRPALFGLESAAQYFFNTWDQKTICTKENIRIIILSHKYVLLGIFELSVGINSDKLHKYIFLPALRANACAVCIGINHISGNLEPTKDEMYALHKIIEVGKALDVDVWDFDIITKQNFYSFRKMGRLGDELIHDSLNSALCLKESIRNAVKVDYLKDYVKKIEPEEIIKMESKGNVVLKANVKNQCKTGRIFMPKGIVNNADLDKKNLVSSDIVKNLQKILPKYIIHPELITVHSLKIIKFYVPSLRDVEGDRTYYTTVPKILLLGKWLLHAGFKINERVKVIPLQHMLIIIPEPCK